MRVVPQSRTLFHLLGELADLLEHKEAVVSGADRITYRDLETRSAFAATHLQGLGVTRGTPVALLAPNSITWIEIAFGAAALGAPIVAISTWATLDEIIDMLAVSQAEVLIAIDQLGDRNYGKELEELKAADKSSLGALRRIVTYRSGDHALSLKEGTSEPDEPYVHQAPGITASAVDLAFILFTSGSTAKPKPVPLQHFALIENGFNIGERQGLTSDDRVWVSVPLFWSYGAANALMATFTHGATLVLQDRFDPDSAIATIDSERCTSGYLLPTLINRLLDCDSFDRARLNSLKKGLTIGTPNDLVTAMNEIGITSICNIYGSTETYGNCCVTPHDLPASVRVSCQGPPLPGVTVRIRDPRTDRLLQQGQVGEVEVSGYVTPGYLGDHEEADAITPEGFYRTGDLGWLDEAGMFHFAGRYSEVIKTSGINVSPLEIEECLVAYESIAEAAVTSRPDEARGEVPIAYVRVKSGGKLDRKMILAHCEQRLAKYKIPREFFVVDDFPKTETGKIARQVLHSWARQKPDGSATA